MRVITETPTIPETHTIPDIVSNIVPANANHTPPTTNVYLTIFAGRKRYLSILKNYLDILLEKKIVTEVHLWDYVRDPADSIYIQELAKQNPKYVYIKPLRNMKHWDEYYMYYTNIGYNAEDILIKCDDDIVYIDTEQMCAYLNEIKQGGLYFPNIVNNDVCAYVQTKFGVHNLVKDSDIYSKYGTDTVPLTNWHIGWYMKYDCAAAAHSEFLGNQEKFKINAATFPWKGRISINMFGARFESIKQYFELFLKYGKSDDEAFFSYNLYKHVTSSNHIVPFMNVVHFAFGPQNATELDKNFLDSYSKLSNGSGAP